MRSYTLQYFLPQSTEVSKFQPQGDKTPVQSFVSMFPVFVLNGQLKLHI